jgi:hypothetical protein
MMVGELAYLGQQGAVVGRHIPGRRESCYQDDIYGSPCQSVDLMGFGLPPSNHMVHAFSNEVISGVNGALGGFGLGEDPKATVPARGAGHFVGATATSAALAFLLYRSAQKEGSKGWKLGEYIVAGLFGLGAVGGALKAAGVKVPGV